jgi:hypothetical protein
VTVHAVTVERHGSAPARDHRSALGRPRSRGAERRGLLVVMGAPAGPRCPASMICLGAQAHAPAPPRGQPRAAGHGWLRLGCGCCRVLQPTARHASAPLALLVPRVLRRRRAGASTSWAALFGSPLRRPCGLPPASWKPFLVTPPAATRCSSVAVCNGAPSFLCWLIRLSPCPAGDGEIEGFAADAVKGGTPQLHHIDTRGYGATRNPALVLGCGW